MQKSIRTRYYSSMKRSFIKFHGSLRKYSNIYHRTYLCRYQMYIVRDFLKFC